MELSAASAVVTGGASGLGLATARRLASAGAFVVIVDLPTSAGADVANELGDCALFAAADITDEAGVSAALDEAERRRPVRALVHCAGIGGALRLVERDGRPGSLELFETVIRVNLIGTYNVLRLTAARMARNEPDEGERGACVLTASVAA